MIHTNMRRVEIYIYDTSDESKVQEMIAENNLLGFTKNVIPENTERWRLTDFYFDEKKIIGYWIDPEPDDDSGTIDIIFYIGSTSFRTPVSKEKIKFFEDILKNI
jgi:hypothetical protein